MAWDLAEALAYYQRQGAPGDQSAVIALLREIQTEHGGSIPSGLLPELAAGLNVKESYFLALIRRIPSLRLGEGHVLEVCAGPNCPKKANLAFVAEQYKDRVTVRYVPCMRLCGKGPNIRWDGVIHHQADEKLIRKLVEGK